MSQFSSDHPQESGKTPSASSEQPAPYKRSRMIDNTTDQYLRPLGAFELTIDLYMHRNPVQFSLTAELTRDVSEEELTQALQKLQRVHPLLAAEVDRPDHDGHRATGAVFRPSARAIPVRVARNSMWEREVAIEQTEPVKPAPGPLARAVLIPAGNGSTGATVVVTFAHQITDGRGALRAVQDLATILDGEPPGSIGPSCGAGESTRRSHPDGHTRRARRPNRCGTDRGAGSGRDAVASETTASLRRIASDHTDRRPRRRGDPTARRALTCRILHGAGRVVRSGGFGVVRADESKPGAHQRAY